MVKYKKNKKEENLEEYLKKQREYMKIYREKHPRNYDNETPEQREKRLIRQRTYYLNHREECNKKNYEYKKRIKENETPEQKEKRLLQRKNYYIRKKEEKLNKEADEVVARIMKIVG